MHISFLGQKVSYQATSDVRNEIQSARFMKPLSEDIVVFGARRKKKSYDCMNVMALARDLARTTSKSDWKKTRKGSTKVTESRQYKHPQYGVIKVGVTIDGVGKSDIDFKYHKVKVFMAIPDSNIIVPGQLGTGHIFDLAKCVIGPEHIERLQKRAEQEQQLTSARWDKMVDKYGLKEKKRKNRNMYLA